APAGLQSPGDCQKVVCTGTSGTSLTPVDDPTDIPGPTGSACLTSPACCGPSPLTPCYTPPPTGTPRPTGSDPAAHVRGDTTTPTVAGTSVECNSAPDCFAVNDAGTLACDPTMGVCE